MAIESSLGLLARVKNRIGAAGAAVQQLVEILQPGPLEGRAGRWEHARRQEADAAVARAVQNWSELQKNQQALKRNDDSHN